MRKTPSANDEFMAYLDQLECLMRDFITFKRLLLRAGVEWSRQPTMDELARAYRINEETKELDRRVFLELAEGTQGSIRCFLRSSL